MSEYQDEKDRAVRQHLENRDRIMKKYPFKQGTLDGYGSGFNREMREEQKRFMKEMEEIKASSK